MEKITFKTEKEFFAFIDGNAASKGYSEYKDEKLSNFDSEKGFVDVQFFLERESDDKKFTGEYTRGGQGNRWADQPYEIYEIVPKVTKPKVDKLAEILKELKETLVQTKVGNAYLDRDQHLVLDGKERGLEEAIEIVEKYMK